MIFFTSDLHFYHGNVIKYCNRPWSTAKEMNEGLIDNWNAAVAPGDTVYMLGDISFASTKWTRAIMDRLNGHKKLIRGNHDSGSTEKWANCGVELTPDGKYDFECFSVYMSHYPWRADAAIDGRFLDRRLPDDGKSILLHGHVHNHYKIRDRQINVGVDVWNYRPVSETQILWLIDQFNLHGAFPDV